MSECNLKMRAKVVPALIITDYTEGYSIMAQKEKGGRFNIPVSLNGQSFFMDKSEAIKAVREINKEFRKVPESKDPC